MNTNSTLRNLISAEDELLDMISDEHISTSFDTPLRTNAFEMDDDIKIQLITKHFTQIMDILGLDLTDDSLKDSPKRVAKMYVKEIFSGLNPKHKPKATLFENKNYLASTTHIPGIGDLVKPTDWQTKSLPMQYGVNLIAALTACITLFLAFFCLSVAYKTPYAYSDPDPIARYGSMYLDKDISPELCS